ncbi:MAG TPA: hypothetical protein VKR56_07160 [Candidatus Cybelea sp.]|nr:hypothetical protein [Candidatus Cybelea sp.]
MRSSEEKRLIQDLGGVLYEAKPFRERNNLVDSIVESASSADDPATGGYFDFEAPASRSEDYELVGFEAEKPSHPALTLTVFGMRLIEHQQTFASAKSIAETLADSIARNAHANIVELLETVRAQFSPSSFADLIEAFGTVELGDAVQPVREYLALIEAGNDEQLRQAAQDAIDLIEFAQVN